ncbi:MAG: zinc ribbon domain-containing protein [Thermoplasmata archaeon]|nr:zinc ribbon domain-containing protein [Thermoplasmata archaeon]
MTKDEFILILLVIMGVVLAFELAYIMLRRKRRKKDMFRKKEPVETVAERAHNLIITTESISRTLANQGINTLEADALLRQAKTEENNRDYSAAAERAEAAKLVLLRLKREQDVTRPNQPASPSSDPEKRPMNQSLYDSVDTPLSRDSVQFKPAKREDTDIDSLPTNYVQAKFMLGTTKDLLDRKGITSGEAYGLYQQAKELYDQRDYSRALSCTIKADKLLDSDSVGLIAEETSPNAKGIEVYVCPSCDSGITEDDAFCRECGEKLEDACPGCDEPIDSNDKFCRKCGYKL